MVSACPRLVERLDVDDRAGCGLAPVLLGEPLAPFGDGVGFRFGLEHVAEGLRVGCLVDVHLGDYYTVVHPARLADRRIQHGKPVFLLIAVASGILALPLPQVLALRVPAAAAVRANGQKRAGYPDRNSGWTGAENGRPPAPRYLA